MAAGELDQQTLRRVEAWGSAVPSPTISSQSSQQCLCMEFLFVQLSGVMEIATNLLAEGCVGHGDSPGEALLFPVRFTMHYQSVCCVLCKHYMYSPGLTLPVAGETGGDGEEVVPQAG